ncbi:hypothetical protein H0H93_008672 [Arthromyces matolae]|nr:hypothetical protein H0H93_008672 [Arthromyces matolae]
MNNYKSEEYLQTGRQANPESPSAPCVMKDLETGCRILRVFSFNHNQHDTTRELHASVHAFVTFNKLQFVTESTILWLLNILSFFAVVVAFLTLFAIVSAFTTLVTVTLITVTLVTIVGAFTTLVTVAVILTFAVIIVTITFVILTPSIFTIGSFFAFAVFIVVVFTVAPSSSYGPAQGKEIVNEIPSCTSLGIDVELQLDIEDDIDLLHQIEAEIYGSEIPSTASTFSSPVSMVLNNLHPSTDDSVDLDDEIFQLGSSPHLSKLVSLPSLELDDLDEELLSLVEHHKRPSHNVDEQEMPLRKKARADRGGGNRANVDPQVAHYWHPDCNRNGSRSRNIASAMLTQWPSHAGGSLPSDVSHADIDRNDSTPFLSSLQNTETESMQHNSKSVRSRTRIANKFTAWRDNGQPPSITPRARRALTILSEISSQDNLTILQDILRSLSLSSENSSDNLSAIELDLPVLSSPWILFQKLADRCLLLENCFYVADFKLMVAQVQLALLYDRIYQDDILAGRPKPTREGVAEKLNIPYDRFRDWIESGTRLAFLSAAGKV